MNGTLICVVLLVGSLFWVALAEPFKTRLNVPGNITFSPPELTDLIYGTKVSVNVSITCYVSGRGMLRAETKDEKVVSVASEQAVEVNCTAGSTTRKSVQVQGNFLGISSINFSYSVPQEGTTAASYRVVVRRETSALQTAFIVFVAVFVVILNFAYGSAIELAVLKEILKKPIPPAIGFGCQFVLMPCIGLAVSHILPMNKFFGFGLLTVACSPGGGASNSWTVLFNGDLNLSITMTFLSKIGALAMMPFWLWAAGRLYVDTNVVEIPFTNLVTGMLSLMLPLSIGMLIRHFKPNVGEKVRKAIRPLVVVFVLTLLIFGSISNPYIYEAMGIYWYIIPSAMMLAYFGFILGYVIARILQLPNYRAITVALETGFQDTGVAIILLQSSFVNPLGELASVIPIAMSIFAALPFYFTRTGMTIRTCWKGGRCQRCGGPPPPEEPDNKEQEMDVAPDLKANKISSTQVRSEHIPSGVDGVYHNNAMDEANFVNEKVKDDNAKT